jgi:hypothetical protein
MQLEGRAADAPKMNPIISIWKTTALDMEWAHQEAHALGAAWDALAPRQGCVTHPITLNNGMHTPVLAAAHPWRCFNSGASLLPIKEAPMCCVYIRRVCKRHRRGQAGLAANTRCMNGLAMLPVYSGRR